MDWEDKFTSIVKETELNLAKAKKNLSSKAHNPLSSSCQETVKSQVKSIPTSTIGSSSLRWKPFEFDVIDCGKFNSSLDNMSTSSIQVFHMQEQIDSQNRTIEKLNHLVKSLDGERDYYKEQISLLKGEVDLLTCTMKHQPSSIASDLKMSNVKRELMLEMEKVKSLVQKFGKDAIRPAPSPRFDPEVWNIKENLTSSLDQVRFELSQMKGRIDRMEGQIAIDNLNRSRHDSITEPLHKNFYHSSDPLLTKPLYTPTSKVTPRVTESDLSQLRMAISSINSKIDNIERKGQLESKMFEEGNIRSPRFSPRRSPYNPSLSQAFDKLFSTDDLHSLSDPSDLSNISEDIDSEDDDIADLLDLNLDGDKPISKDVPTSILKENYSKKGRVEFDLCDLDLSDIEEIDGVEFLTDSLDLDQ